MTAAQLIDIQSVKINKILPVKDRVQSMAKQLKDPYNFKHNDVVIHINFVGNDTLEEKIVEIYKNT